MSIETRKRRPRTDALPRREDKQAIYLLMEKVKAAIAEYDTTSDHLKHGPSGDCIRCRLVKALEAP